MKNTSIITTVTISIIIILGGAYLINDNEINSRLKAISISEVTIQEQQANLEKAITTANIREQQARESMNKADKIISDAHDQKVQLLKQTTATRSLQHKAILAEKNHHSAKIRNEQKLREALENSQRAIAKTEEQMRLLTQKHQSTIQNANTKLSEAKKSIEVANREKQHAQDLQRQAKTTLVNAQTQAHDARLKTDAARHAMLLNQELERNNRELNHKIQILQNRLDRANARNITLNQILFQANLKIKSLKAQLSQ